MAAARAETDCRCMRLSGGGVFLTVRRVNDPRRRNDDDWVGDAERAVEVLEAIAADHTLLGALDQDLRRRLVTAAGQVSRPEKTAKRALASALWRRERDAVRRADVAVL